MPTIAESPPVTYSKPVAALGSTQPGAGGGDHQQVLPVEATGAVEVVDRQRRPFLDVVGVAEACAGAGSAPSRVVR